MISIKTKPEQASIREASAIAANALRLAGEKVRAGITTRELDRIIESYILSKGAKPSFKGYDNFPAASCISLNDTVIHGIPDNTLIKNTDIVSIDVGAYYKGFHGDNAATFAIGEVSESARLLMKITKEALYVGIKKAVVGARVGDIGCAIEQHVKKHGFSAVRDFVGHGVGRDLHEGPEIPNFGKAGYGARLVHGMTIAIEPMINERGFGVNVLKDGWTVKTKDGGLSAHYEHTILIHSDGPQILTNGFEE